MDLRSTKSGLTKSIRRFRATADVRTIGSFRGAIEPGFSDWVGNHWRLLGTGWFKPVRLNFREPKKPFELVRWPRVRSAKTVHYAFSPKIQLTFPFNPINNLFFETNTDSKSHWLLTAAVSAPTPARERVLTSFAAGAKTEAVTVRIIQTSCGQNPVRPTHEFWTSFRQVGDQTQEVSREIEGTRTLLLVKEGSPRTFASGPTLRRGTASSWSFVAPLFLTIVRAAQHWTQSFKSSLIQPALWPGQGEQFRENGIARPGSFRSAFDSRGLAWTKSLFNNVINVLKTAGAGNSPTLRQSFSTHLTILGARGGLSSPGDLFTNLSLTLVAPKPADPEAIARQIQFFGPPSELNYGRRDGPQMQSVVNALRDLRFSQSETKTQPVPRVPSIEQVTSQVRNQLERELRIEKERRGR